MKIALIVNPYSGGKKAGKILPLVEKLLRENNIGYTTYMSLYHEHILKIMSELNIKDFDAVIAMGGDGTNFHVLNGLLSSFSRRNIPPLGIIPIGSGNSFAKDLDILSYKDAINSIVNYAPKWVDLCAFTQGRKKYYFVNLTGLGFVTDVAKTAQKFKFLKEISYIIGVLYRTIALKSHYMEIELDGKKLSQENCFVEFCNSRYTGGNMMMAPDAEIDDGFMDVIIARKMSRISLIRALPTLFKGTHIHHPAVQQIKTKKAAIRTWPDKTLLPDGELFGATPTTITIHHKAIQYLI